jgi:uncharacterized damage-inducible protein DinB
MVEELIVAWRTNNRINTYLIDRISPAGMKSSLSKRGGRDVARQFGHMHNVRIWQMEKRAKDLANGLVTFETKVSPTKTQLKRALAASGRAVELFLVDVLNDVPKRRGFKKGIFTTLSYFIAHESHHRGSVILTLKECGYNLEQSERYAIWDWDRM